MQIVYVLGTGSKHGNVELRWSLRSIAKHGRGISEVVVAGEDPGFLNPETVRFVPLSDRYDQKHLNILDHLLTLIDRGVCKEEFLYSSDDHLYLRPVDFSDYPVYLHGELVDERDWPSGVPINKYHRSLFDTKRILEEHGYPAHCFHGHVNTHIDPEYADRVKKMLAVEPRARYGYEPTEMFMNAKSAFEDMECVTRRDCKFRAWKGPDDFDAQTNGMDCVSFSDSAFLKPGTQEPSGFEEFVESRFPGFCKYEKERADGR